MVGTIIFGLIAIGCFIISFMQFKEKGFLFNNAYIYASKEEREKMDKRPHYRQSGIAFLLIGLIFVINAIEMSLQTGWLFYVVLIVALVAVLYAIISSISIEKKK